MQANATVDSNPVVENTAYNFIYILRRVRGFLTSGKAEWALVGDRPAICCGLGVCVGRKTLADTACDKPRGFVAHADEPLQAWNVYIGSRRGDVLRGNEAFFIGDARSDADRLGCRDTLPIKITVNKDRSVLFLNHRLTPPLKRTGSSNAHHRPCTCKPNSHCHDVGPSATATTISSDDTVEMPNFRAPRTRPRPTGRYPQYAQLQQTRITHPTKWLSQPNSYTGSMHK